MEYFRYPGWPALACQCATVFLAFMPDWRPNGDQMASSHVSSVRHSVKGYLCSPILTGQRMERPDHRVAVDLARVRPRVVEPDVLDGQHPDVAACKTNNPRDGRSVRPRGESANGLDPPPVTRERPAVHVGRRRRRCRRRLWKYLVRINFDNSRFVTAANDDDDDKAINGLDTVFVKETARPRTTRTATCVTNGLAQSYPTGRVVCARAETAGSE